MKNPDDLSCLKFTGPAERDKALNTLIGIVSGMWADGVFNSEEIAELREWCHDHRRLAARLPFSEIIPKINSAISDGEIDKEEFDDILWVLKNSKLDSSYFEDITKDIQELHGMLHGIIADQKIDMEELRGLQDWIYEREHLKGCFPYDEIESLVLGTLRDGVIDKQEHEALLAFFKDFVDYSTAQRVKRSIQLAEGLAQPLPKMGGVCAVDPLIEFDEKVFVFTGISARAPRQQIAKVIAGRKGRLEDNVAISHYLVVGNNGNPAWAFACYGRKVEKAMNLRKEGKSIVIVNEVDFWDALER